MQRYFDWPSWSKWASYTGGMLYLYAHCAQNELLRILYPVFVHCFMDLVAKDFPQEGRESTFLIVFELAFYNQWFHCNWMRLVWFHTRLLCTFDILDFGALTARLFFQTFREDHDTLHLRDLHKLEGVLSPQHLQVLLALWSQFQMMLVQICLHISGALCTVLHFCSCNHV